MKKYYMSLVINLVTSQNIINHIKKSKYFQLKLGVALTKVNKSNDKILNDKDEFSLSYNTHNKSTILKQGEIGHINIYIDHNIKDSIIKFYYSTPKGEWEEFIVPFEDKECKDIDTYLGNILKELSEEYQEILSMQNINSKKSVSKGNSNNIINNPGSVTYQDLKSYMRKNKTL